MAAAPVAAASSLAEPQSPRSLILAELTQMFGDLPMDTSAIAAGMPATRGMPTTVSDLKELWQRIHRPVAVYEFYGHGEATWGPSAPLSNFWQSPFLFVVPAVLLERLPEVRAHLQGTALRVNCSETAIMLMKAMLCRDFGGFVRIHEADQSGALDAAVVKRLGRGIANFVQQEWDEWVIFVAIQAVTQKFHRCVHLRHCLASTGTRIIAETVATDRNWATGSNPLEPGNDRPCSWRGLNILGLALMVARYTLKVEASQMRLTPEEHQELHRLGLQRGRAKELARQAKAQ